MAVMTPHRIRQTLSAHPSVCFDPVRDALGYGRVEDVELAVRVAGPHVLLKVALPVGPQAEHPARILAEDLMRGAYPVNNRRTPRLGSLSN